MEKLPIFSHDDIWKMMYTDMIINPFPNCPGLYLLQCKSSEKTEGTGEIARKEQFLLFPKCFVHVCKTFCHFHQL